MTAVSARDKPIMLRSARSPRGGRAPNTSGPRDLDRSEPGGPVLLYGGRTIGLERGEVARHRPGSETFQQAVGVRMTSASLGRLTLAEPCGGDLVGGTSPVSLQPQELSVLIASDQPRFRAMLKRRLEIDGHRVVAAADVQSTLALTTLACWDLICIPHQLAGASGLQLAQLIRARQPDSFITLLSSLAQELGDLAWRNRCVDALLPKPWRAIELRKVLVRAQARRSRRRMAADAGPNRPA